jgi:hypothetical protein
MPTPKGTSIKGTAGRTLTMAQAAGTQVFPGDVITTDSGAGWAVLQGHTVPATGYNFPPGYSDDRIHWTLGYATSGLGPGGDARILNPDGSAK